MRSSSRCKGEATKGRCTGKRWLVSTRSWLGLPPYWSCSCFCGDTALTSRAAPVREHMQGSIPQHWAPSPTYLNAADEAGTDALLQPNSWSVSPEYLHNLEEIVGKMKREGKAWAQQTLWGMVWSPPQCIPGVPREAKEPQDRIGAQQAASPNPPVPAGVTAPCTGCRELQRPPLSPSSPAAAGQPGPGAPAPHGPHSAAAPLPAATAPAG